MDEYDSPDDVVKRRKPDIPVTCFRPAALRTAAAWFVNAFPGRVL
jgi:ornithine decarboxylase